MSTSKTLDIEEKCFYQDEVVCPYCFYEATDSYEYFNYGDEDTEVFCGECDKKFFVTRHVSVSYSSRKYL